MFRCPKSLEYQFSEDFKIKVSEQCCNKLKKDRVKEYEKTNNKSIAILGLMQNEGGQRASHSGCVVFDTKDTSKLVKFKPLNPITKEFENWFIETYSIKLCRLYYPPYNFKRTGWTTVMPCINYVNPRKRGVFGY